MKMSYETACAKLRKKYETLLLQKTDIKTLKCLVLTYRYRQFLTEAGRNSLTAPVKKQKAEEIRNYLAEYSESVKYVFPVEEWMKQIQKEAVAAGEILDRFQRDLKEYCQCTTGYLMHVTAQENLTDVTASHQRLNMYHTSAADAVFATSSRPHTLLYAGRVLAGDMQVVPKQRICIYRRNPFQYETKDVWKLSRPVYICLLEYEDFIPVIDFIEASPGNFRICFEHEWSAFKGKEPVRARETLEEMDKHQLKGYRFYTPSQNGQLKRIG